MGAAFLAGAGAAFLTGAGAAFLTGAGAAFFLSSFLGSEANQPFLAGGALAAAARTLTPKAAGVAEACE